MLPKRYVLNDLAKFAFASTLQWRNLDFQLGVPEMSGSSAEPQTFFSYHALFFGYKWDQIPFSRLKSR